MPPFGQIVIGPPGAGKSTFCNGMNQFLNAIGRHSYIINLDPANDRLPYDVRIDVRDFITLEEIMEQHVLGPNGGLIYLLETFEENIDLFVEEIKKLLVKESCYIIFDCPGQTELFTNNQVMNKIFGKLVKELDFRLCVVSLIDCINIVKPSMYISMLLLTLRSMLQLDLPQISVFSKIDLLKTHIMGEHYKDSDGQVRTGLPFDLNYYTEVQDLSYLIPYLEEENNNFSYAHFKEKYHKLTGAIAELIEDFNLIEFEVLSVDDKNSMINILSIIDKANGYLFGSNELGGDPIWTDAVRQSSMGNFVPIDNQERWVDEKEKYDEIELKNRKELIRDLQSQQDLEKKPVDVEDEWEQALLDWEKTNGKPFVK